MAHLADRLKGQDNRGPKLPSLGQQARQIVDARKVGQLVEHEPDAAVRRRRQSEHRTCRTLQPACEQRLRCFEIILLTRHEYPGLSPLTLVEPGDKIAEGERRSEEPTSELQSLMRISYAVFCLKKNKTNNQQ